MSDCKRTGDKGGAYEEEGDREGQLPGGCGGCLLGEVPPEGGVADRDDAQLSNDGQRNVDDSHDLHHCVSLTAVQRRSLKVELSHGLQETKDFTSYFVASGSIISSHDKEPNLSICDVLR